MKRALLPVVFLAFGAGCGLDTEGLGDLSHQPGSTVSQRADAGLNVDVGDGAASPVLGDAQAAADGASAPDAAAGATGCGASTCGAGAVCCAEDVGGGVLGTSCAMICKGGAQVVCNPHGAPCADGSCTPSGKFAGLNVCD